MPVGQGLIHSTNFCGLGNIPWAADAKMGVCGSSPARNAGVRARPFRKDNACRALCFMVILFA